MPGYGCLVASLITSGQRSSLIKSSWSGTTTVEDGAREGNHVRTTTTCSCGETVGCAEIEDKKFLRGQKILLKTTGLQTLFTNFATLTISCSKAVSNGVKIRTSHKKKPTEILS